jgi:hypothetical protein
MNEFTSSLKFECAAGANQCFSDGSEVVKTFALETPGLWYSVLINACLAILFCLLGMIVFHRTSAPMQKLK